MKKKHLVISFDKDEQQWFYDIVYTESEDEAKSTVLDRRTYCVGAEAYTESDIKGMSRNLRDSKPEDILPPEVECGQCGNLAQVSVLDDESIWCAGCLAKQEQEDAKFDPKVENEVFKSPLTP